MKKGASMSFVGGLIMSIFIGAFILLFFGGYFGWFSPNFNAMIGGANIVFRTSFELTEGSSVGKEVIPIVLANQYKTPYKINAMNYASCPGINRTICDNPFLFETPNCDTNCVRKKCVEQCARIQVDNLVELCWGMAGKGEDSLRGAFWNGAKGLFGIKDCKIGDEDEECRLEILRCFRFQIVNPIKITGHDNSKGELVVVDETNGNSWFYSFRDITSEEKLRYLRAYITAVISDSPDMASQHWSLLIDTLAESSYSLFENEFTREEIEEIATEIRDSDEQDIIALEKLKVNWPSLGGEGIKPARANAEEYYGPEMDYRYHKLLSYYSEAPEICYVSYYDNFRSVGVNCDYWKDDRWSDKPFYLIN